MVDVAELAIAITSALSGGGIVGVIMQRMRTPAVVEAKCAGYGDKDSGCNALRSPMCTDGRCSFHCRKQCSCDPPARAP